MVKFRQMSSQVLSSVLIKTNTQKTHSEGSKDMQWQQRHAAINTADVRRETGPNS